MALHVTLDDLTVMARTVWGEARGEPAIGKIAVAAVILNRARRPGWWGRTVSEVCLAKYQFTCWLPADPNRERMLAVNLSDRALLDCVAACLDALRGIDPTDGACHYLNPTAVGEMPRWAMNRKADVVIGRHYFYRGVD